VTFAKAGTYTAILTVRDAKGMPDPTPATLTVTVSPKANLAPNGTIVPPATITQGQAVTFQGNGSDPDGNTPLTYAWDFGGGAPASTAQNPVVTFANAGTYTVKLTVTDAKILADPTPATVIVTVAPRATTGGTTTPATGLVAAYGFNEGTGTTLRDSSGNNNSGVISGATWAATGRFGKALSFNGTSNWVTVADAPSLDLTTGMTLEAWVYPQGSLSGWRSIVMKEQPTVDAYYLEIVGGIVVGDIFVAGSVHHIYSPNPIPLNAWTHMAATYDGSRFRLYVNGVEVANMLQSGPIQTSSSPLRIGGNAMWGEYFQGIIDEVRIYNRALSAAEIDADMNTPTP
jgi:PKD repeat protein